MAALFIALSAALAAGAFVARLWLLFAWAALGFFLVGIAYLGFATLVFAKSPLSGRVPFGRKVLLAPFLALASALWHLARLLTREPAWHPVVSGLVIGRRLLAHEYPADVRTIVDLTWEFDEHLPPGTVEYLSFPILDGAALAPSALRELAQSLTSRPRPIYIHCAQGHGRTGMVAAAFLHVLQPGTSLADALAAVRAARPGVRLSAAQEHAVLAAAGVPSGGGVSRRDADGSRRD